MSSRYCFDSLTARGCTVQNCPLRHDIQRCTCELVLPRGDVEPHVRGQRHRQMLDAIMRPLEPASSTAAGQPSSNVPRPHGTRTSVPMIPRSHANESANEGEGTTNCSICNTNIPLNRWRQHVNGRLHMENQFLLNMQANVERAESDKNGITVSVREPGLDFGVLEAVQNPGSASPISLHVTIQKTETDSAICLTDVCMSSSLRNDAHGTRFSVTLSGASRWIKARPRSLAILFHPSYEGRYEDVVEMTFYHVRRRLRFMITRRVCATVGSQEDHEILKPKAPYVKREIKPKHFEGRVISMLRPSTWTETKWVLSLPLFLPPAGLIAAAFSPRASTAQIKRSFMPQFSNERSYSRNFQVMLHIEGEQMRQDLLRYSMEDAELRANYPRYDLEIPGLAEGRPSVLVGDFILVRHQGMPDDPWWEARVHAVHVRHVSLRFDSKFSTYRGNKFEVQFKLNRLPLRRMHQALVLPSNEPRMLFPGPQHETLTRAVFLEQQNSITPINRSLGEDEEQMQTICAIVNQPRGSVPFVVFGPPGTGKTVTIVEAIKQLLLLNDDIRILACAPSNSAADLIAQRLTDLGPTQLFRLNALSRKCSELSSDLPKFSLMNNNVVFAIPSREVLQGFRVIVSTCISAGVLYGLGLKPGHFSHIFIDEAGQAMEPTVMIPIKTMANKFTNIILAGDNKQLGPVVHSRLAISLGLKQSYLDRIMSLGIYDLRIGRGRTIVKLVKNFRSHPAILQFSNRHFYDGELQACGNPALTHSLENSSQLVTNKFPLVFHGINGRDQQEESSPSYFNVDEATVVKNICASLIGDRRPRIRPGDIGIITPYHAQRCKILDLLHRDHKLSGIKVGSVEEFQGQERRVIIMSTVRSTTEHVRTDIRRTLGFVANPPRFNVAITRAQALCIVVGNPTILSLDPLWRSFLNYIHKNGGCRGMPIDWDPTEEVDSDRQYDEERRQRAQGEVQDMIERLKALIVERSEDFGVGVRYSDDEEDSDDDGLTDQATFREEE